MCYVCGSQFSSFTNSSGQAWWKCLPAESFYGPFTGIFKTRSHQVTHTGLEFMTFLPLPHQFCVLTPLPGWLYLFICSLYKKLLKAHHVSDIILNEHRNEQHRGFHLMKPFSDGQK